MELGEGGGSTNNTADSRADAVDEFGVGGVLGFYEDSGGFEEGSDRLEASGFHGFARFCWGRGLVLLNFV